MAENKEAVIRTHVNIEVDKNDNRFVFMVPAGAPLGEAFDACMECLDMVSAWHKKAIEKAKERTSADQESDQEKSDKNKDTAK